MPAQKQVAQGLQHLLWALTEAPHELRKVYHSVAVLVEQLVHGSKQVATHPRQQLLDDGREQLEGQCAYLFSQEDTD